MKKILLIVAIAVAAGFLVLRTPEKKEQLSLAVPTPTTHVSENVSAKGKPITVSAQPLEYVAIGPVEPSNLHLILNLPAKKTSRELKEQNNCSAIINAGFYDKNDQPLGLIETSGIVKSPQLKSALLNGLFWVTSDGKTGIGTVMPDTDLATAFQSGPILLENGQKKTLSITNDENARRMVLLVLTDKTIRLLSVFGSGNTFTGPLLADLPSVASAIGTKEQWNIESAINLDGGNHSALITTDQSIEELSPVGSVICVK